ncbi:MAG: DUF2791 family P-loop domain-containing protein [Thermaerobacter sp.]|nr:DUF2791 family P-loop domain-containing protein [Thermaerobacter sp.]
MDSSAARTAVEHLRAGVPSAGAAQMLSVGRRRILGEIEGELAALQAGRPGRHLRIIAANYGEGKSHTLNAVRAIAARDHFLVSQITVSRETPLDRVDRVYRKLVSRTYYPGVERPGIDPLLHEIADRPEAVQRLLRFAQTKLHPKIGHLLEARLEGKRGDIEPLDGDLSGYLLPMPALRRAYDDNMGRRLPKMDRFVLAQSFDYLRLIDEMAVLAGLAGWLILIDEVEMIGRIGRRARALSYALLRDLSDPARLPHTYSVAAVAASFQADLADRLDEAEQLPLWLRARGQDELADAVPGIVGLLAGAPHLPPLSEADLAEVFDGIAQAHATAYGWYPPLTGAELLQRIRVPLRERDIKVRQLVRAAVHFLDLTMRYGDPPKLRVHGLEEPVAEPSPADDAELPEGDDVVRGWSG